MRIELRNFKENKSFELVFPFWYSFKDMANKLEAFAKQGYVAYAVNEGGSYQNRNRV